VPTADPATRRLKQQTYAASDKGRATEARRRLQRTQSGFNRTHMQEYRAAKAAYLESVFHPSPDKRIPVTGIRRLVVLQDLQIPFEDPKAVSEALSVVHRVNPDAVVLDGDIVDCYQESSFLKDFRLAADVTDEQHRRVRAFMALLGDIRVKIWMGGNHEERWWRTIKVQRERETNSPVVTNLLAYIKHTGKEVRLQDPIGSFSRVFGAADHGFTYYPWSHRLYFAESNLVVCHGKYVSRHSGVAAKRTYEWLGRSAIVGHTHRMGTYQLTQDGRQHGAWENGCLCQLEPEYDDAPNWQQGMCVVEIDGPYFRVIPVPIVRKAGSSDPVALY
jgi:predicted phosphodiesterase